jgi:streptogramin lyase
MINPTDARDHRVQRRPQSGHRPGASIVVGPDGNLWFMNGGTIPSIG